VTSLERSCEETPCTLFVAIPPNVTSYERKLAELSVTRALDPAWDVTVETSPEKLDASLSSGRRLFVLVGELCALYKLDPSVCGEELIAADTVPTLEKGDIALFEIDSPLSSP
jgi:hypothetical protein